MRDFISHYAEDHAVSLPGRVAGFKRDDILLLPSSVSKNEVHQLYVESSNATSKLKEIIFEYFSQNNVNNSTEIKTNANILFISH